LNTVQLLHIFTTSILLRDAPIIGIGRLLCRYRSIVIYYVLWWDWIL